MPTQEEIENYLRQQVGIPTENTIGSTSPLGQKLDQTADQAIAMKQAALQHISGQNGQLPQTSAPPTPVPIQQMPSGNNIENSAPLTFDAMDKARAAQLKLNTNPAPVEEDMSGYTDYPKQQPIARKFPNIQKKINNKQPINKNDISDMMNPKLVEEDEDQPAKNVNNKAGSAEGSYGS